MTDVTDPMKYIWEKVSAPSPDGRRFIRYKNHRELEYLYETGFVDTEKFPLAEWVEAFRDSLQPDGSYQISERQWLEKEKYRYNGPVGEPFDPMTLREGEWDRSEFDRVIAEKFLPSLAVDRQRFQEVFGKMKEKAAVGDTIRLTRAIKVSLRNLLETYPSPRRMREVGVQGARKKTGKPSAPPPPYLAPVASGFTTETAPSKTAVNRLDQLLRKGK